MKRFTLLVFLVSTLTGFSQPSNDDCENAIRLCPGQTYSGTTAGATTQASDNNICYTSENSVWFVFTTNDVGGGATVSFTNLVFNPDPTYGQNLQALFFQTSGGCGITPYTPMSNCGNSSVDFDLDELIVLDPNTTYYVQVSGSKDGVANASECTFDISISGTAVEVMDPTVTLITASTMVCQGVEEPLSVSTTNCNDPVYYQWNYNGTTINEAATNTFSTASLTENGNLELIITCGINCPKSATSNVVNYTVTPVTAEAGDDKQIQEGGQASLEGSGIGNPTWSPSSSLINENDLFTVAAPLSTTTYFLTMENDGCFATDSVTVFVGDIITIFSAFSPNGDGVNDRWHILNSDRFPNMEVNVYSRYGQRVFNAVNYSQEEQWWDGTFRGKDLPVSTYFYVVRLNDAEGTEYKGQVSIVR